MVQAKAEAANGSFFMFFSLNLPTLGPLFMPVRREPFLYAVSTDLTFYYRLEPGLVFSTCLFTFPCVLSPLLIVYLSGRVRAGTKSQNREEGRKKERKKRVVNKMKHFWT
jgi:hypothetical protein